MAHSGEVKRLCDNPVVIEFASDGAKIEVAAKANTALWSPALDDVSCASDSRRGLTS
jgi:hypothetical protein